MGVLDDLRQRAGGLRARRLAAALRRAGPSADLDGLERRRPRRRSPTAAYLLGDHDDRVGVLQRAFGRTSTTGDPSAAVRCAFYLAMRAGTSGEPGAGAGPGPAARRAAARRASARTSSSAATSRSCGCSAHSCGGDFEGARSAGRRGRRHRPPLPRPRPARDRAVGAGPDRALRRAGAPRAWRRSTRRWSASPPARSRRSSPATSTASMIEGCQEISDFGRAAEWTAALQRWCDAQPGLVAVHRASAPCTAGRSCGCTGRWDEALREFDRAVERYVEPARPGPSGSPTVETRRRAAGCAATSRRAEAAYQRAGRPRLRPAARPGPAVAGQGRTEAAVGRGRRLLAETPDPVHRSPPAARRGRGAARGRRPRRRAPRWRRRARRVAADFGCAALLARRPRTPRRGRARRRRRRPARCPTCARRARCGRALERPYDAARVRVLTGGPRALGDDASAARELSAARAPSRSWAPARRPTRSSRCCARRRRPTG